MKRLFALLLVSLPLTMAAGTVGEKAFKSWASTPPMGWNSWDCYGPTVVESEVKANADYMAAHLKDYGWEYVVVDIRWFVENDKAGGYNQTDPVYVYDEYGRYTPALNRFPSASDGNGFKPLADYVHNLGLKFGIHIMRGIPKEAVAKKLPVLGAEGVTADMIASNDSACTWLRDNMKVDWSKKGAQAYYNSIFDLYAQWGVDFVKIDDISRPYHTAEIEMVRHAIDQCGRPIVLSISPGETPLEKVEHVKEHANMWRTVDDFWDNWSQLNYQFGVCAKWAPYISSGTWPDADMLPLGKISIRGERGAERWTSFTQEEQKTMMNLWMIFKSPLMFGGDLPQNDDATNALLTNEEALYMHHYSVMNREARNRNNHITWTALDPRTGARYAALFNIGGSEFISTKNALWRSGTISYLTTGYITDVDVAITKGAKQMVLVATDGGDGYDCDHADWINPEVVLADGSKVDVTGLPILRNTCGWGETHVNSNLNGGKLSIDGTEYDKGIATHANSVLVFDLPENAVRFTAKAGIDNTGTDQGSKSSIEFFVFDYDPTYRAEYTDQWTGGNVLLQIDPDKQECTSGLMSRESRDRIVELEASVKGKEKLYLVVTNGGDNLSYDHADWVNPVLVRENGEEVSLTTISWNSNPVNGWYSPKLNLNNDGNRMKVAGTEYDTGFGVNAPSMLVFDLPEGHDFVSFKVACGLDNDIDNAPFGATVEFRIFTEDPSPVNDANVALDLSLLGFEEGMEASVTDMWTHENMGSFKDSGFAPMLKEHGSGLYKVASLARTQASQVTAAAVPAEGGEEDDYNLEISVESPEYSESFVQIERDGEIVGAVAVGDDGKASYHCGVIEGEHTYKVYYSGTLRVMSSESDGIVVRSASVDGIADRCSDLGIIPGKGSLTISSEKSGYLDIHDVGGQLVKRVKLRPGVLTVNLPQGIYIAAGEKINVP